MHPKIPHGPCFQKHRVIHGQRLSHRTYPFERLPVVRSEESTKIILELLDLLNIKGIVARHQDVEWIGMRVCIATTSLRAMQNRPSQLETENTPAEKRQTILPSAASRALAGVSALERHQSLGFYYPLSSGKGEKGLKFFFGCNLWGLNRFVEIEINMGDGPRKCER